MNFNCNTFAIYSYIFEYFCFNFGQHIDNFSRASFFFLPSYFSSFFSSFLQTSAQYISLLATFPESFFLVDNLQLPLLARWYSLLPSYSFFFVLIHLLDSTLCIALYYLLFDTVEFCFYQNLP